MIRTSRKPIRKLHFGYGPGVTDPKKINIMLLIFYYYLSGGNQCSSVCMTGGGGVDFPEGMHWSAAKGAGQTLFIFCQF